MKILIIEDNELIAKTLERNLRSHYKVDLVYSGLGGIHSASSTDYDLILLDLNLPDIGGELVCTRLRKQKIIVPIIIISGKSDVKDRIDLLNVGADDYLVKPFNIDELRARIEVALRHSENKAPEGKLIIDELILDPNNRTVLHFGDTIMLRRKEFDLLLYLIYNKGQTLTRAMIMGHIWGSDENLWANVIDVHIKHLRDKIDRPYKTRIIQTVHGVGYRVESLSNTDRLERKING